jgi:hypothetical protein
MQLIFMADGRVRCIYGEQIDLATLGDLHIIRASHVEPGPDGFWYADLSLVEGPILGPFTKRSDALAAEVAWLETNWLAPNRESSVNRVGPSH